jgi:hypothetical protein
MRQLKRIPVVALLLVGFLCFAYPNAAQAGPVTSASAFLTGVNAYYLETFAGLTGELSSPQPPFSSNGFSYEARAETGTLYGLTVGTTPALTDFTVGYSLIFSEFSPNVTAFGGTFFSTDEDTNVLTDPAYTLTLVMADGNSSTAYSPSSFTNSFVGFLDPGVSITSIIITPYCSGGTTNCPNAPTVENFYVGSAITTNGSVPEPATFGLLGAGLIAGGLLRKRLFRA